MSPLMPEIYDEANRYREASAEGYEKINQLQSETARLKDEVKRLRKQIEAFENRPASKECPYCHQVICLV